MKNNITTIISSLLILILSCTTGKQKLQTPKEFVSNVKINKEIYTKDSVTLLRQLNSELLQRLDFFQNSSYDDSTQLIIDTILYSPQYNKLAAFLMVKNPISNQRKPNKAYDWFYDETCYLGEKNSDSIVLSWLGPSFTNSYDKNELSKTVRNYFFTGFARPDTVNANHYPYNLNDVRFWQDSLWGNLRLKKLKEIQFEKEKLAHPENVFEPVKPEKP